MQTVSVSPLPVGSARWQQHSGAWVLTLVCKATYELRPEACVLRSEQEPLHSDDVHVDGDSARSVLAPADLVPGKPRADVVLVGSAFAPSGKAVRSLVVRMTVGEIDKAIEVFCDRSFLQSGELREGAAFTQMALGYERAAGGPETLNPIGVRADVRDSYGRRALPNLQRAGQHVTEMDAWIDPVGFGPIAAAWPWRRARISRFGSAWSADEWRRRPFPEGFDHGFFNAAPTDQQVTALDEGARLVLENLHRDHPRLATKLPGLRPVAFVVGRAVPAPIQLRADTLWIDTDRALCTLTFRGQLQLERAEEEGRVLVGMQRPGESLTLADLERAVPPSPRQSQTGTVALNVASLMAAGGMPSVAPLPFRGTPGQGPTVAHGEARAADSALPFASGGVSSAPGPSASESPSSPGWPPPSDAGAPLARPWPADAPGTRAARRVGALPAQSMPAAPAPPMVSFPPAPASPVASAPPRMTGPPQPPPPPPAPVSIAPAPVSGLAASPWVAAAAGGAPSGSAGPGAAPASSLRPSPGVSPIGVGPGAAAAAAVAPWLAPPKVEPFPRAPAVVEAPVAVVRVHELVWFDPESVPRMRRNRAWKPLLDALEDRPADPDLDDPALADDAMALEDRREVFEILSQGKTSGPDAIAAALQAAVRPDGKRVSPLVLGAGELTMRFDEIETLKATVTTVEPLVVKKPRKKKVEGAPEESDEPISELEAAVTKAKEFLKNPDLLSPPAVTTGFTRRICEAFAAEDRALSASYVEEQTDAVLLEKRHYQKRIVFGDTYLRSLWAPHPDEPPLPVYLPESLAKKLPMFKQFEARWIAEAHGPVDQYEKGELALRVVALARVMPSPKRA
jgi:hypothetical protein